MSSMATSSSAGSRSPAKLIFFLVFFLVTAFVTFMKNQQFFVPASEIARHFAPGMAFLIPHAIFAGLALAMGAFQFSDRLRARNLRLHKTLGYIYVVSVMIGAPFSIPLAVKIGTPSLVAASVVQSFGWMVCTGIALYCIRTGNVQQHRRWMMRGYPFAMIFTVARILIPIPPILRSGNTGIEIVVWTLIALAAFLPSLVLEWRSIAPRRASKVAVAQAG